MIIPMIIVMTMYSRHRMITIQVKKAQEVEYKVGETHDEKNGRLNRPMSPHLTIYKPQLTTILSITHRGTGVALSGVTAGLGARKLLQVFFFNFYLNLV